MDNMVEEQEPKKYNKIQWFFVVIFIPTIFAIFVASIVATVAGINVVEKTKEFMEIIPFIPTEEEISEKQLQEEMNQKLENLKLEVEERESAISELETEINAKNQEIESLELEKESLQKQMENLILAQEESSKSLKEIVSTYETMSAKKAAPIISQMNENEALEILSSLKPDTLAAILEKMDVADAANYTVLLTSQSIKEN